MSGRRRALVVPSESGSGSDSEADFEVLDVSLPASGAASRAGSRAAEPAHDRRRRRLPNPVPNNVIEILDSDDEDAPRPRPPTNREFQQEMNEAALERQARGEQERRRDLARLREVQRGAVADVRSPPPPAGGAAPPRTFGGAVFRRGDEQVRFRPDRPAQHMRLNRNGEEEEAAAAAATRVRQWRVTAPQLDPTHPDHVFDDPHLPPLRPRVGMAQRLEEQRGLQHFIRSNFGRMMDAFGWNAGILPDVRGGLGERAPPLDPKSIVDAVKPDVVPPPRKGYTRTWDPEDLAKEVEDKEKRAVVIQLDERGVVVPEPKPAKPKGKVYLACAACPEPLRVSGATRTTEDRVWALRCGHMLDERCFKRAAQPSDDDGVGEPAPKRARKSRAAAKKREHAWKCPVCEREHVSVLVDGAWEPKPGFGGIQVYV